MKVESLLPKELRKFWGGDKEPVTETSGAGKKIGKNKLPPEKPPVVVAAGSEEPNDEDGDGEKTGDQSEK